MKQYILPLILICGMCLGSTLVKGQDIHYTLFNDSYLTTNPALTGSFYGSFRIGGIFRDQWYSILPNEFVTPSFYIDSPIMKGFRKGDWIGAGVSFFNDQVGQGNLKSSGIYGSLAYHFALDKKANSVFTIGIQGGSVNRSIDVNNLLFEDNILTGGGSADAANIENASYIDINAGALFKTKVNDDTRMTIGFAVNHIGSPDYNLNTKDSVSLNMLATLHGGIDFNMNEKWDLSTALYLQKIAGATTVAGQGVLGYKLNEEKDITLRGGLGYRVGDAAQVIVGADIKSIRIRAAYDFNANGLSAVTNNQGGFELALSYIGKIFKKPEVKPTVLCPDL